MARDAEDGALIELYCRPAGYFILAMDRSETGVWMASGAVVVVPPDASDQHLAAAVWTALASPTQVTTQPGRDQWSAWRRGKHAPILRAAKVRSWIAFETGASQVSVGRRGHHVTVTPHRVLGHPRGAREEMTEHRLTVEDPSRLAHALRSALVVAETMLEGTTGDQSEAVDAGSRAALLVQAQERVRPLRLAARPVDGGYVCDLVAADGRVAVVEYGAGPDELLAVLAAEQRYLVEQAGRGSVRGSTYLEKARERLRRGAALDS